MAKCTFCGKTKEDGDLTVTTRGKLCQDCIRISEMFIEKKTNEIKKPESSPVVFPRPHDIKKELDRNIIGQEDAKKVLSVEICNHVRRVNSSGSSFKKTCFYILGPTGSGKTMLAEAAAKLIDVPLVITDATTFTEAGYAGRDVQSCLTQLLEKANYDIKMAEKGIVYVDEADKMVIRKSDNKNGRDIRGEGVQQAFLKMIEGSDVCVEIPSTGNGVTTISMDTRNILFIFGGTFDGIGKIVAERLNKVQSRQLVRHDDDIDEPDACDDYKHNIIPNDIIKYGFIKEFVGRVPMVVTLRRLTMDQMMSVLTKTDNSILKEYHGLFSMHGIELKFEDDALTYTIEQANAYGIGARGIRGFLSRCLNLIMYDVSQEGITELLITKKILQSYSGRL